MKANLKLWTTLWNDELGFIVSAELVLVSTILVLGLITGLSCLQGAIIDEYRDISAAFTALDQSYYYRGMKGCFSYCGRGSRTFGSAFSDNQTVVLPEDIDIVPCQQPAVPYQAPACPNNDCTPLNGVPCDKCPSPYSDPILPDAAPMDHQPQGPQPAAPVTPSVEPASVRTATASGTPLNGPRFPG